MNEKANSFEKAENSGPHDTDPLISIVMSVYNAESTLVPALDSIFEQTYTNWELIICDDGSTDGTLELLRSTLSGNSDIRYKLLVNESNRKLAYSLNRCLEAASGEFIARMDGDDISAHTRLQLQVEYLISHPEVDLVGTAMQRFNSAGLGDIVYPAAEEPDRWTLTKTSFAPFCHATILARRSTFKTVGNYTVSWYTERAEDLDLWFKIFSANLVGRNLRDPLYMVREDEAAVRRRTPKARFGAVVTRIKGHRMLGYPLRAYRPVVVELLKILVPYKIYDLHRNWKRR